MLTKKYYYEDKQTGEVFESEDFEDVLEEILNLVGITFDNEADSKMIDRQNELKTIIKEKYINEELVEVEEEYDPHEDQFMHDFNEGWQRYSERDLDLD